jgi:NADPH:quinone reductase
MKAVVVSRITPDYSGCMLEDVPMPVPASGQVLIRVHAASLNFPDLLLTRGLYQLKPKLPFTPGMDVSGTVASADFSTGFREGDAVVGATRLGGFADYVAIDAEMVRPKPASLSHAQAAAFGAAYLTAYVSLVRCGDLRHGQWLLVHGASGGVGLAAVDLGIALGARVIAASASQRKLEIVAEEYGPEAILDIGGGFRDRVNALSGGGVDCVYDPVGGDVFDESTRCIAFGGKLLVVGFASGRIANISTNIPLIKGFSVVGVRAGEFGRRFPTLGREDRDRIWSMAQAGMLRPRVHRTLPIEQWREAFEMMERREVIGKVILLGSAV